MTNIAGNQCNYSSIPFEEEIADTVSTVLDGTLSLIMGNLTDVLSSDWTKLSQRMSNTNRFLQHLDWSVIWVAFCCLFTIGVIAILLLSRVVALLCRRRPPPSNDDSPYTCWIRSDLQPNLLLPPFTFLVLVIWVFFSVYILGLLGASDFCDSPVENAVALAQQHQLSPFTNSFLEYFFEGKTG